MNKIIKYSLATMLSFGISSSCLAIVITDIDAGSFNSTDVGVVDLLVAQTVKVGPSDPVTEAAWVNTILAPTTVDFTVKIEDVAYYTTDTANVFAFIFNPTPGDDYFLIKNSTQMALFQNIASLDWGVFNTSVLDSNINLPADPADPPEDWQISHVTSFDETGGGGSGSGNPVPEPGILALFGMGLMGMGLSHIRRKRKTS